MKTSQNFMFSRGGYCSFLIAAALCGASAAFAALPSGYTEVGYIASSGTQYIDTGVVPQSNSRLVCDFQYTSLPASGDNAWNGWCAGGGRDALLFGISGGNFSASACSPGGGSIVYVSTGVPADVDRHTVDIQNSAMCFDGNSFATGTLGNTFTENKDKMYLFARHIGWSSGGADSYCSMRIYSCQIYSGDTPVRDFVPAVREDGAVGLYDTVNNVFFTNRGSGVFTSGTLNRFAISPIANCYVSPDELAGGVEPEVRVYDDTTSSRLVLGRDYTVSYQDNTSWGAAKAVATGKGAYAGESAEVSFVIACGKAVTADYSLSADEDWTNYDFVSIASGVTIDLNGHNMTISGLDGSGTVTDSVGGGELHCAIPASYLDGYHAAITNVTLKGKLTLVKEGPGVLTAIKESQTYTGETVVNAGTLKYGCVNKSASMAYPFGQISVTDQGHITINAGGVLDPGGANGWGYHTLIINGGMISNTVAGGVMKYGIFNPKMTVNGDFTFATTQDFGWTVRELGGHTGTVDIATGKYMYVGTASTDPPLAEGGRIVLTGGGYLRTLSGDRTNFFNTVDLEMTNGALWLESNMIVHDYTPAPVNKGKGSAELNVLGTFTPATDYFYGPTMQNGSAIDLSAKTDAWSVTSLLTDGGNAATKFAADATVTVILGERKCKVGDKVISWTTAPDSTVSFTSRKATFESRSDGLYITEWKGSGLSVFVR